MTTEECNNMTREQRARAGTALAADLVEQAVSELQDVMRCRCHKGFTDRGLHDPACQCDSQSALDTILAHITAQAAQIARLKAECDGLLSTWAESRKRHLTAEAKVAELEAHIEGTAKDTHKLLLEAEADLHGPISVLTAADRANILAHMSPELAPAARLPNRNSIMMDWVQVSNEAATLRDEVERLEAQIAGLQDPAAVHANMLRGTIAKPTLEQIIHLYGRDALVKALVVAPGFLVLAVAVHSGFWFAWVQTKDEKHCSATEADPARAWLIAILRALEEEGR